MFLLAQLIQTLNDQTEAADCGSPESLELWKNNKWMYLKCHCPLWPMDCTKLLGDVFVCICITTSPFTSLLKSIIYGNGTSTLLWALCGGLHTHTHTHTQSHIKFRACLRRAGRLNRWHWLYPLHRLPNTHTDTLRHTQVLQLLALWVHLI